jgi:hypothetical protein
VTAVAGVAALAIWLLRCLPELGPGPEGGAYNSDSAIPVLMANQAQGGPYDWLFWGQDRFGAWPFLLARLFAAIAGPWTPHTLHLAQAFFLGSALLPWLALAPRGRALSMAGFLLLPVLSPVLRRTLVDLGHVDAWQLGALLWTWWALRRAAGPPPSRLALGAACLGGALATWSSLVSGPLLLVLGLLESVRAGSPRLTRAALCLPALAGFAVEAFVRTSWHAAVRGRHWPDVRTRAALDLGHLVENVVGVTRSAVAADAWPWLIGVLALGAVVSWRLRVVRREGPESAESVGIERALWTVLEAAVCVLACLGLLVAARHVRENGWAPRYLGVPLTFAILGVGLAVGTFLERTLERFWPRLARPALAVAGLVAVLVGLPRPMADPRALLLQPVAESLARRFPGAVLVDGYWRTYALAAFVRPGGLIPLPAEGEWNRRPDWVALLHPDRPILVGTTGPLALEPGTPPPPERLQYGVRLALVRSDVAVIPPAAREVPEDHLSLYRVLAIDAEHGPAQHPRN